MHIQVGLPSVDCDYADALSIAWNVSEYAGRLVPKEVHGNYYWNVVAHFSGCYYILESGVLLSKVEALTRARGRARFFRAEQEKAK